MFFVFRPFLGGGGHRFQTGVVVKLGFGTGFFLLDS